MYICVYIYICIYIYICSVRFHVDRCIQKNTQIYKHTIIMICVYINIIHYSSFICECANYRKIALKTNKFAFVAGQFRVSSHVLPSD